MSSNPFRRSQINVPTHSPSILDSQQTFDNNAPPTTPPKRTKQKRVQIQTPPHSPEVQFLPEDGSRRLSASFGRSSSPPPPPSVTTANDDFESDSPSTVNAVLQEAQINARRNSFTFDQPPITHNPPQSGVRAPYNPFARTLATSEASFASQPGAPEEQEKAHAEQQRSNPKPPMDVDMFKNILLTGSAPPPHLASQSAAAVTPRSQGSSSIGNAVSPSNRPLSHARDDFYSASPRASFDEYESASEEDEREENENASLMGVNRPQEIAPPAPPKPKGKGPQTVSFADFDQSFPTRTEDSGPRTSSVHNSSTGISRPIPMRSSSDLNKPLPPPPAAQSTISDDDLATIPSHSSSSFAREEPLLPKKVPPPPPASRRQAAGPGRPRSTSDTTQESISTINDNEDSDSSSKTEKSFVKIAPPPPPARKAQSITSNTSSSAADPPTSSRSSPDITKAMPPPPPRRQSSKTGSNTLTLRNASEVTQTNRESNPASAPPVPPPRRGATNSSKRNSLDGRPRSSASSGLRASSRDSATTPRQTSAQSTDSRISSTADPARNLDERSSVPPTDLLADLTAFQAEIDALRARAGGDG